MSFNRITIDPMVCSGRPCIRDLQLPVARVLELLAAGQTRDEIMNSYPRLEDEDIAEALRYAVFLAEADAIEFAE